jgi:hypothetical protein
LNVPDTFIAPRGSRREIVPAVRLPRSDRVIYSSSRVPPKLGLNDWSGFRLLFGDETGKLPFGLTFRTAEANVAMLDLPQGVSTHEHPKLPGVRLSHERMLPAIDSSNVKPLVGFSVGF